MRGRSGGLSSIREERAEKCDCERQKSEKNRTKGENKLGESTSEEKSR